MKTAIKIICALIFVALCFGVYQCNRFTLSQQTLEVVLKNDSEITSELRMQASAYKNEALRVTKKLDSTSFIVEDCFHEDSIQMGVIKQLTNEKKKLADSLSRVNAFLQSIKRAGD